MSRVLGLAVAVSAAVVGCGSDTGDGSGLSGTIAGAGASSQAAAMRAWIVGFGAQNSGVTVNYDPTGSGAGREQFVAGGVDFAGSDVPLDAQELPAARDRCGGDVVELPLYVSPIAIAFHLDGVDELRLRPATIAGIFSGAITNWNDPRIAADNPGVALPDVRVAPVHRSDQSGTTENFTDYLAAAAPEAWPYPPAGNWPIQAGEAAQGTSGVVGAVMRGNGTIGYADAGQVGDLDVVAVGVGEEFVPPSPQAAAAILEASDRIQGRGQYSYVYDLRRDTSASGAYPVVLVSYSMACADYDDTGTAALVGNFLDFAASPEGQRAAAQAAGSAPITDSLRAGLQPAIDAIAASPTP